ncbi:MAG TPA: type II toxin-antitoxin system RelE/ParE family toxin [Chloroflexota bacterium]|nr:type II toxin-antitoxin system RelE/ParE family toxin [Chloroflexota bacterium]
MKQIEWTGPSLEDMVALDKGIARRVKQAVERFAESGAGSVKKLQGIDPPEYRLRVGDYRIRFEFDGETVRILRVRNRREAYR